jgi:hypothetical protein
VSARPADAGAPEWEPAPAAVLRRWEDSGAVWRVVAEDAAGLTIGLLTCDAGEEVARFRCSRAAVADLLGDRVGSDDP